MKYTPLCIAVAIFVLDVLEKVAHFSSPAVVYLWLLGLLIVSISVIGSVTKGITQRAFWTRSNILVSLGVITLLVGALGPQLSDFYDPLAMHPESARQASCGIKKLHHSTGIVKTAYSWCFLGYNTRQYIPQALLFEYFGPSVLALNIPYLFFVLIGFLSYVSGLKAAVNKGYGGLVLLLTAVIIPLQSHFYFFLTFAYEQSVFPFGLTLLILGLLLHTTFSFTVWNFGLSLLVLQHLLFSYTPAISVYCFAAGILGLQTLFLLPSLRTRIAGFIAVVVCSAAHFWLSLAHRADIRLMEESRRSISAVESTLEPLLRAVFYTPFGKDLAHSNMYSMAIVGVALLMLVCFASFRLRALAICTVGWSVAHVFLSAYSKGYAAPPIPFALHRALPTLPALGLIIFFGYGLLRNKVPKVLFGLICVLILCWHLNLGLNQSRIYHIKLENRRAHTFPHATVLGVVYDNLSNKDINHLTLGEFFSAPGIQTFPDYASYYFPHAEHSRSEAPALPKWHKKTKSFTGLYVGGKSDVEPYISGAKPLPEGMSIQQVIKVGQVRSSMEEVVAYVYTRN